MYFSDSFVLEVRHCFLQRLAQKQIKNGTYAQNKYELIDLQQLQNDDWFIRRFLMEKPATTVSIAVKKMHDAMIWRKKFGVNLL